MRTVMFGAPSPAPKWQGTGPQLQALQGRTRIATRGILTALRRRKWIVLEAVLLAALAATLVTLLQEPLYQAKARIALGGFGGGAAVPESHESRAEARAMLLRPASAGEVLQRVGAGDLTRARLIARSSVSAPEAGTLEFRVSDTSPPRAVALATEWARQFSKQARTATVLPATRAESAGRGFLATIVLSGGIGLLVGIILALIWDAVTLRRTAVGSWQIPAALRIFALEWLRSGAAPKGESEHMSSPDKQELVADVSALEGELERLQTSLTEAEEKLKALERQKTETAGSVIEARRALGELERRLEERRETLAQAERDETQRKFEAAVAARDTEAVRLAGTLDETMDGIDSLDAARAEVAAAQQLLDGGSGRRPPELPAEPAVLAERWDRLVGRVRQELDVRLEDELLDAAARSPMGQAIDDLPAHLREAARQRRRFLLRGRLGRAESNGT